LDVLLRIIIAASSLAEKVFQEHDQSAAMASRKWLDPLRDESEYLIAAFHQAITDDLSKATSSLGGKFWEEH